MPEVQTAPSWRERLTFGEAAAGAVVFLAICTALGVFIVWARLRGLGGPTTEALAIMPRETFVLTGLQAWLLPFVAFTAIAWAYGRAAVPANERAGIPAGDAWQSKLHLLWLKSLIPLGIVIFAVGAPMRPSTALSIAALCVVLVYVRRSMSIPPKHAFVIAVVLAAALPAVAAYERNPPQLRRVVVETSTGQVQGYYVASTATGAYLIAGREFVHVPTREIRALRVGEIPEKKVPRSLLMLLFGVRYEWNS